MYTYVCIYIFFFFFFTEHAIEQIVFAPYQNPLSSSCHSVGELQPPSDETPEPPEEAYFEGGRWPHAQMKANPLAALLEALSGFFEIPTTLKGRYAYPHLLKNGGSPLPKQCALSISTSKCTKMTLFDVPLACLYQTRPPLFVHFTAFDVKFNLDVKI